jgi:hypothetical protein
VGERVEHEEPGAVAEQNGLDVLPVAGQPGQDARRAPADVLDAVEVGPGRPEAQLELAVVVLAQ